MRRYGSTVEHFVKVAYKNHKNSVHTPYAQYQQAFTMEEIANSRMISWPNTLLMCCPTGDGAAAAVIASADKARQFTTHPIKVAASVLTSDPYTAARPGHVRRQHPDPKRRPGGLQAGRASRPGT